jgi:hypothetical protein
LNSFFIKIIKEYFYPNQVRYLQLSHFSRLHRILLYRRIKLRLSFNNVRQDKISLNSRTKYYMSHSHYGEWSAIKTSDAKNVLCLKYSSSKNFLQCVKYILGPKSSCQSCAKNILSQETSKFLYQKYPRSKNFLCQKYTRSKKFLCQKTSYFKIFLWDLPEHTGNTHTCFEIQRGTLALLYMAGDVCQNPITHLAMIT